MKKLKGISLILITFFMIICLKNTSDAVELYATQDGDTKTNLGSGVEVTTNGNMIVYLQSTRNYDYAKQVVSLVNTQRASAGLSAVTIDKDLTEAAMHRAAECAIVFDHTRPNGTSCFTISNKANRENIAAWQTTPSYVMNSWMKSPGHKENILASGNKSIGVGCVTVNGAYYWVQLFSNTASANSSVASGTQSGYAGIEVPISNMKTYVNNAKDTEIEVGKEGTLKTTGEYKGQTFELDNTQLVYTISDSSVISIQNGKVKALKVGAATITTKVGDKTYANKITVTPKILSVYYRTHVQNVGWQSYVRNGTMSGTSGKSLRLEGINIYLDNTPVSGGIEYSTHVQNIGWQGFVKDGAMSGTSGRSLRLEAIKIRLTGEMANKYDIYYRVHSQNFGWMGWAKNGEAAGSAGYSYRLEGIEIKLVSKGGTAPGSTTNYFKQNMIYYKTHVQNVGWQSEVLNGQTSGTSGRSLRLEGITIRLANTGVTGGIEYSTHVQNIGWQGFKKNGAMSGTSGRSLRLEAIKIRLTGEMANKYDVYYRVHAQNFGWMGWAKNGAASGSAGYGYRLEGIQIQLVNKGGAAPGSTANAFRQR